MSGPLDQPAGGPVARATAARRPPSAPDVEAEMPLVDHLEELRGRLFVVVGATTIGAVVCFAFNHQLIAWLLKPAGRIHLVFTAPAEYFLTVLKISVGGGLVLALPVIFYEAAAFAAPGLTRRERRAVIPLGLSALLLFAAGVAFCYVSILPVGLRFLLGFAPPEVQPMLTVGAYLSFAFGTLAVTGAAFELPLVLLFLAYLRIVTSRQLANLRKYFVLVAILVAAVVTPTPDMFTQGLLAGALVVLYELSIWIIRLTGR